MEKYTQINQKVIDSWVEDGWEWGIPISHEKYLEAKDGKIEILLTPTKLMPRNWLPDSIKGLKILGLAAGGGQQMPILCANGADCTVVDLSPKQLESERIFANREGYNIDIIQHDITTKLPFEDETFDIIINPVSLVYVEDIYFVFKECSRILKKGGRLICGLDNGVNFLTNEDEKEIVNRFPFNPLKNKEQYDLLLKENDGIQFSHSIEENIKGQLINGFTLVDVYDDTNGEGRLHQLNIPTFYATLAIKK